MSNSIRNIITQGAASAPVSAQEAEALRSRIQEALNEINQAKEWDEYATMEDTAQIELLEAKLKATLTLINHFLATGEWEVPGGTGAQNTLDSSFEMFRDVAPGWNGDFTLSTTLPPDYGAVDGLVSDGEFQGFIYVDEPTADRTPQLAFQASASTIKIEAFNHGSDIVYVETYLDESGAEQKRFWIGKDHVTNISAQIMVTAHNLDHGITMDFHRAYRISDGSYRFQAGTTAGFVLMGTDYNDTIIGSQGGASGDPSTSEYLVGLGGDDVLVGEGGIDVLYGDYSYFNQTDPVSGAQITPDMVIGQLGLSGVEGDDTLDGGAGQDVIRGDGGVNYGVRTDPKTGPEIENQSGIQHQLENRTAAPPSREWFDASQSPGWKVTQENGHVVEISETAEAFSENSTLTLQMPEGYDYAYADDLPNGSIKITFVKHVEGAPPQSFVVIVKGALSNRTDRLTSPFTLKILGNNGANIIDFHDLDLQNNNFIAEGLAEDDMILAPVNDLNRHGLSLDDLIGSANRVSEAEVLRSAESVVQEGDGIRITPDAEQREIVVSRNIEGEGLEGAWDSLRGATVAIDTTGYDQAYVVRDPSDTNDLLVVLVKFSPTGGAPQTLVIRIENYVSFSGPDFDAGDLSWLSFGPDPDLGDALSDDSTQRDPNNQPGLNNHIPLFVDNANGQPFSGNYVNTGAGEDFVFEWQGDNTQSDISDTVVTGDTTGPTNEDDPPPGSGEDSTE